MKRSKKHRIAIVVFNNVVPFDFTAPYEVFERAQDSKGQPAYNIKLCAETSSISTSHFDMTVEFDLSLLRKVDSIIIPGISDIDITISPKLRQELIRAYHRGARLISTCTGAFLLAATGLLANKAATTHWIVAEELQARYPDIKVDAKLLYTNNNNIFTSAGATASLDLCLHIIRQDLGAETAAISAKAAVMTLERDGDQAQFIQQDFRPTNNYRSLGKLMTWTQENPGLKLTVAILAARLSMSERSLHRKFKAELGITPNAWIIAMRLRIAQRILESTNDSIELVASKAGFGSAVNFREQFKKHFQINPTSYRRAFSTQVF